MKGVAMSQGMSFHFVRLWQSQEEIVRGTPTLQQRVLAISEVHAVVQLMKQHHLKGAARAWVSRTVHDEPTVRLACILLKGKKRSWKIEPQTWVDRAGVQSQTREV
jgi:S-methylmethionine-dependent homocysteine/selenocysteine methylase